MDILDLPGIPRELGWYFTHDTHRVLRQLPRPRPRRWQWGSGSQRTPLNYRLEEDTSSGQKQLLIWKKAPGIFVPSQIWEQGLEIVNSSLRPAKRTTGPDKQPSNFCFTGRNKYQLKRNYSSGPSGHQTDPRLFILGVWLSLRVGILG